jgi:hypothetical protein
LEFYKWCIFQQVPTAARRPFIVSIAAWWRSNWNGHGPSWKAESGVIRRACDMWHSDSWLKWAFILQLRTTKVNKFLDQFVGTYWDFLRVQKPSE